MSIKVILLLVCGFLALSVGTVGVFMPVLPTTPFVLVAAACFGGSSPKLYHKLENSKYFGEYINAYRNKTGVSKAVKVHTLIFLWVMLCASMIIFPKPFVIAILLVVGISVSVHIIMLKLKR